MSAGTTRFYLVDAADAVEVFETGFDDSTHLRLGTEPSGVEIRQYFVFTGFQGVNLIDEVLRREVGNHAGIVPHHVIPVDLVAKRLLGSLGTVIKRTTVVDAVDFTSGVNQAVVVLVNIPVS